MAILTPGIVYHYILFTVCRCFSVSQMRAVDHNHNLRIAEMLREVLEAKIKKCRREMLDTYIHAYRR
jgi:hypothetical protein